jgi:hypothetical protein
MPLADEVADTVSVGDLFAAGGDRVVGFALSGQTPAQQPARGQVSSQ